VRICYPFFLTMADLFRTSTVEVDPIDATALPLQSTTDSAAALPVESASESSAAIPVASSSESAAALPVASSSESASALPVASSSESASALPVASSSESAMPLESATEFPAIAPADVMATDVPMASVFNFPSASKQVKRSAKFLYSRDTWCEEYGRPCRLVVYSDEVIADACSQYLGESAAGYNGEEPAVTVTETAYGPTATVTASPTTCEYPDYTDAPTYGEDDYVTSSDYEYYETSSEHAYEAYPTPSKGYGYESEKGGYEAYTTTTAGYKSEKGGYEAYTTTPAGYDAAYPAPSYAAEYPHDEPKPEVCGPDKIIHTVTAYVTVEDSAETPYHELPAAPHYVESSVEHPHYEPTPAPHYEEYSTSEVHYAESTPEPYYVESSPASHYEEYSTTEAYYAESTPAPSYYEYTTTSSYEESYPEPTSAPYYGDETSSEAGYYGEESTTEAGYYGEESTTEYYGEPTPSPYYGDDSATDVYAEPTTEASYDEPAPTDAPYATPTSEDLPIAEPTDAPYEDPAPVEDAPADEAAPVEGEGEWPSPTDEGDLPTTTENPFAPGPDGQVDWVVPGTMEFGGE
jgi:hypothetical protein